jgi:ABC-type transporter Mla subunit MlaD
MEHNAIGLRVGAFVIAGIVALLALLFFLSGSALHPGIQYESYFQESVEGLDVGTAVKFRGVTIGQVTDIGLVNAEYPPPNLEDENQKVYQQVVVRFKVDPDKVGHAGNINNAIAHGLRVQIEPQGITGLSYLDLSFVNPQSFPTQSVPWTPDSTVIPSMPSTLTQVQDAVEQVISSLSKVDLAKMVGQISSLTTALNQEVTTGDAHQALANANHLLANLNQTLAQSNLPATTASIRNLTGGAQTEQIITQLNQTTAQLAKVSAQMPALITASQAAVGQAAETTADLQAQLGPILQDMQQTTANLKTLSAELERDPSQVILSAPPPRQGNTP